MTIEGLGSDLLASCSASVIDSQHLAVEVAGTPAVMHQLAMQMVQGGMTVEFRGIRLVLTHFTVFNQGDRSRLVFTATHRPAGGAANS